MAEDFIRTLLVEDNPGDARLIEEALKDVSGFALRLSRVDRLALAFEHLEQGETDVVVLDLSLPDCSGFETFQRLHERFPQAPVVLLTGLDDEELGARAVRDGAQDYMVKNRLDGSQLARAIRYAVERRRSAEALRKSEQMLRKTFSSLIDAVIIVDARTFTVVDCNPVTTQIFGYPRDEIIGKNPFLLFLDPDMVLENNTSRDEIITRYLSSTRLDDVHHEGQLRRKDGSRFYAEFSWAPLEDDPKRGGNWLALVRDITERVLAQETLRESEERYMLAMRGANDGLWDWDLKKEIIYYSPRWKAMLGYEERELDSTREAWLERIHPEEKEKVEMALTLHLNGHSPHFESEHRLLHRDGSYHWMLARGLAVRDASGVAYRMAGSLTDVTARKKAEQQLFHDAFHDLLTGLPNRALFLDRLGRAIEHSHRFENYLFAVLFLDLDRFKLINDSLGHATGDLLLVEIASMLKTCLRAGDTVARLGGDEFVILLEDIRDTDYAMLVTERIQQLLTQPFQIGEHQVFTSASIGIVLSSLGYTITEDVLRDADIAMYQAKTMGSARYTLFSKEMRSQVFARLKLENDLRAALERKELAIHYQPIISLVDYSITGFEALLRWYHPERGLIHPAEFIPIAEETGLILEIGQWVLEKSCMQIRDWQEQSGLDHLHISINISHRQFCQPDFVKQVQDVLRITGLNPACLNLEITENVLMDNSAAMVSFLNQLREIGIGLHIDDFGTGYSSLSYLQRFPINTLKIDYSFIKNLGINGENVEIVKTIILLARELGVDCVAEGIETHSQLTQLRALNCNFGQGYYIGRPVSPEQIMLMLQGQKEDLPIPSPFRISTGKLKFIS